MDYSPYFLLILGIGIGIDALIAYGGYKALKKYVWKKTNKTLSNEDGIV